MINGVFLGARVKQALKHKGARQQCRQFVRRAAICTDKTLITLNVLNSNEHAYAGRPTRERGAQWEAGWPRRIGMFL